MSSVSKARLHHQDVLALGNEARMNTPGRPTATGLRHRRPGARYPRRRGAKLASLATVYDRVATVDDASCAIRATPSPGKVAAASSARSAFSTLAANRPSPRTRTREGVRTTKSYIKNEK